MIKNNCIIKILSLSLIIFTIFFLVNLNLSFPVFLRWECFLREDCKIELKNYKKYISWDKFCIESFNNPPDSYPCEFCYIIKLYDNDIIVYKESFDNPVGEEFFFTRLSKDLKKCYIRNHTALNIMRRNKFSLLKFEIEFIEQ